MDPIVCFPSLVQYADIEARMTYNGQALSGTWGSKIKLHGTNMSVVVTPQGQIFAQSRRTLLEGPEPTGFYDYIHSQPEAWGRLVEQATIAGGPITVYGEWAGQGIQSGKEAVCRLPVPHFFVFAIGVGQVAHPQNPDRFIPQWMITCPTTIAHTLPKGLDRLHVLPWHMPATVLDFANTTALAGVLDRINTEVEGLEGGDPYIAQVFGHKGAGEGLVFVPIATRVGQLSGAEYDRLAFKAKTERHRVRKQGKPATPREAPPASAQILVEAYATDPRGHQGVHEACGGVFHKRLTGAFVAWMVGDILKEAAREMEEASLTEAQVAPLVRTAARTWYLSRCAS